MTQQEQSREEELLRSNDQSQSSPSDEESQQQKGLKPATPLPWKQLSILMPMRLAEPIAFSLIFPFIGDMIWSIGATDDRADVGLYAGVIESLFAGVQTLTVLQWGRASDKVGRKPIILEGLMGSAISTLLFGISRHFWLAVFARCLTGALNGNVAVYKSLIGELCDRTNAARAFSLLPLCWAAGCTIGPMLGGYLSRPALRHPEIFGPEGSLGLGGLWKTYPFFLPCLVSASITLLSIIFGIFFLEETLPSKVQERREREEAKKLMHHSHTSEDSRPLLEAAPSGGSSQRTPQYGSTASRPDDSLEDSPRQGHSLLRSSLQKTFQRRQSASLSEQSKPKRPTLLVRPTRGRSRASFGQIQSWTSGFTPDGSRDPSPERSSEERQGNGGGLSTIEQNNFTQEEGRPKSNDKKEESVMALLKVRHVRRIMVSYAFLSLMSVAIDSVQVLYFWEPISLGGLSFPSTITGTLLSTAGFLAVGLQLFAFPYLQRRIGTLPLYRYCLSAFPLVPLILPLANMAARAGLKDGHEDSQEGDFEEDVDPATQIYVWLLVGLAMSMKTVAVMAFSCNIILVNQAAALAPGAQLGTLNGLAQMSSSLMRAVGPYAASSLFALSLSENLLGGNLIWMVLFFIAIGGVIATFGLADVEKMIDRGELDENAATGTGR